MMVLCGLSYIFDLRRIDVREGWVSHHGCAAEVDIIADGGEELHALLKTILQRENITTIKQLQREQQTHCHFKRSL